MPAVPPSGLVHGAVLVADPLLGVSAGVAPALDPGAMFWRSQRCEVPPFGIVLCAGWPVVPGRCAGGADWVGLDCRGIDWLGVDWLDVD